MTDTLLDMDTLLDSNLDKVANLPDFVTPPTGVYTVNITKAGVSPNKDATKPARLVITFSITSTISLANPDDMPVPDGSIFSDSYQATEQGLEYFKAAAKGYLNEPDVDGASVRDILAGLEEVELLQVSITQSESKSADGKQTYVNLRIRPQHNTE